MATDGRGEVVKVRGREEEDRGGGTERQNLAQALSHQQQQQQQLPNSKTISTEPPKLVKYAPFRLAARGMEEWTMDCQCLFSGFLRFPGHQRLECAVFAVILGVLLPIDTVEEMEYGEICL